MRMANKVVEIKIYDQDGKLLSTKKTNCMFMVCNNMDISEFDQTYFTSCKGIDVANAYVALMQMLAKIKSKYNVLPLTDNNFDNMAKAKKNDNITKNKGKKGE